MSNILKQLKSNSILFVSNVINTFFSLIRNKLIAHYLGIGDYGLYGLLINITELLKSATNLGLNYSTVKSISASSRNPSKTDYYFSFYLRWVWITGIFGSTIILFFPRIIINLNSINSFSIGNLQLLSLSIILSSLGGFYTSVIQGKQKFKLLAITQLSSSLLLVLFTFIILKTGVNSRIIWLIISIPMFNLIAAYILVKTNLSDLKYVKINLKEFLNSSKIELRPGLAIVFNAFITQFFLLMIRNNISNSGSELVLGAFQAIWGFTMLLSSLLLSPLMADFFPRISELRLNQVDKINELFNNQLKLILIVSIGIFPALILGTEQILKILYSKEFLVANSYLKINLIGLLFSLISFPFGVLFLTFKKEKFSIFTETFRLILFLLFIRISYKEGKLENLGYSYAASSLLTNFLIYYLAQKIVRIKLINSNIYLIIVLILIPVFVFAVSSYTNSLLKFFVQIVVIGSMGLAARHIYKIFVYSNNNEK